MVALGSRLDGSSDEIGLVDHQASDTNEYASVHPVQAVGPRLDFDGTAEGVFTCVDVFSASEPLEDCRARGPHALRLNVEQVSAFCFQRVADVAECCAIRKNELPIGAGSRKQCPEQLRSAEGPGGQRDDAPVTSGDLTKVLGVTDSRFQAVIRFRRGSGRRLFTASLLVLVSVATKMSGGSRVGAIRQGR